MQHVRIGLIGCGNIARRHLYFLTGMAQAQIVACCDIQPERAAEVAGPLSARAYTDYRELLEKETLDAAYICSPTFARADQEILAAQKGLHLFVEKPVALDISRALQNQAALAQAGKLVSVGYLLRYLSATQKVKEFLEDRQVTFASAWYLGKFPELSWFGQMATSGGQLVDQTTHLIDLLTYLVGDVTAVSANFGYEAFQGQPNVDIADSGVVNLRFANGAVGTVMNACCLGFHGPVPGIWLAGEGFFIELTYQKLTIKTPDGAQEEAIALTEGYAAESRAFLDAVLTGQPEKILCPYPAGVKTLAVALAATQSAAQGRPVSLTELLK